MIFVAEEKPQDGLLTVRNRNMLDHDDVPQNRGPTLCMTSKVTAPKTQSKTSYVCSMQRANATRVGRTKHQCAEMGSSSLQISKALHKKSKGPTGQAGEERRRASMTQWR